MMELQAVVWHLQMVVLVIVLEVTWQPLAVEQVMAGRTILRPRRRRMVAWKPQSAGAALLSLQWKQTSNQQVWKPLGVAKLAGAAQGTKPAQDASRPAEMLSLLQAG